MSTYQRCLLWYIEQVFRSMKSDCLRIEDSQMEDANCFTKLAIVGLIAAIRSMQLVMARDGSTSQPITDAADPADMPALRALNTSLEGRTEKLRNPHDESLLAWYAWIVARLGGWSGRAPPADTARQAPRPCIMGCSDWTRSWPAGAWRTVPRMYDSGRSDSRVDDEIAARPAPLAGARRFGKPTGFGQEPASSLDRLTVAETWKPCAIPDRGDVDHLGLCIPYPYRQGPGVPFILRDRSITQHPTRHWQEVILHQSGGGLHRRSGYSVRLRAILRCPPQIFQHQRELQSMPTRLADR